MYRYSDGGGGTSWRNMHATDNVKGTGGNRRTGSSSKHAPTPRDGQGRRKTEQTVDRDGLQTLHTLCHLLLGQPKQIATVRGAVIRWPLAGAS